MVFLVEKIVRDEQWKEKKNRKLKIKKKAKRKKRKLKIKRKRKTKKEKEMIDKTEKKNEIKVEQQEY